MKEKTQTGASETARAKFEEATVFLRDRAEISVSVKAEMSSAFLKAHLKAIGKPFTQADVTRLRAALAKAEFEDIRIPELTAPSPTLVCLARFPSSGGTTIADLIAFVTHQKDLFPNGLATRLAIGDFEGNESHRTFEMQADDGRLALLF